MKNNYEIEKSNYFEKPFPYIVKDNFLDVSLLNDINKNSKMIIIFLMKLQA